jgi:hypothetical protein
MKLVSIAGDREVLGRNAAVKLLLQREDECRNQQQNLKSGPVLELFGHQRLAGMVTEAQLGGASFVRVDVPEDGKKKGWKLTKMYNPSAIYSITPVTEETARLVARSVSGEPVTRWDVQEMVREVKKALRAAPADEYDDNVSV